MNAHARRTCMGVRFTCAMFSKLRPAADDITEQSNQPGRDGLEFVHVGEGYGVPSPMVHCRRPASGRATAVRENHPCAAP